MGKRKIEMKLIDNAKVRKRIFEKRRTNLLKKAEELSILCDSKILVVIFEPDKPKPQVWPDNHQEATHIINRFKQQRVGGDNRKAYCDGSASTVNHMSKNQLEKLCYELDTKIAAVMNAIKAKQMPTEESIPKMLAEQWKGKEVEIYQEPLPMEQDWSFHEMMMQNGVGYPQLAGSIIPYVPLPICYFDPSYNQPAYMSYYDPNIQHIPPCTYYPVMPGFTSLMNESG